MADLTRGIEELVLVFENGFPPLSLHFLDGDFSRLLGLFELSPLVFR